MSTLMTPPRSPSPKRLKISNCGNPFHIRRVPRLNSDEINTAANRANVQFETKVDSENEEMIRTLHPSLRDFAIVYMVEPDNGQEAMWAVSAKPNTQLYDTHVAGREVHIIPIYKLPEPNPAQIIYNDPRVEPLDGRRLLNGDEIQEIQTWFPQSIGCRVFVFGWLILLFKGEAEMKDCWRRGVPDSFGNFRLGYCAAKYAPTSEIYPGHAVSTTPNDFVSTGCLGLKLRLQSGQEVITTATHIFVKLPGPQLSRLRLRFSEAYISLRSMLTSFSPLRLFASTPAMVESSSKPQGNTSLGKDVYLSGTSRKIGTITKCYDPAPSTWLPYPYGMTHDLSLISNEDEGLPTLINRKGTPRIDGWGEYNTVLAGGRIFAHSLNVVTDRWRQIEGKGISPTAQAAIAEGAEYSWIREAAKTNRSLLWRTPYNSDRATTYSGSILCLGRVSDSTAKAVVFQSFESPLLPAWVEKDYDPEVEHWDDTPTFKGGFLLPEEIRTATIVMDSQLEKPTPASYRHANRQSFQHERRVLTGP